MAETPAFIPIRTRQAASASASGALTVQYHHDAASVSSADSTYGSAPDSSIAATHDVSRVSYHVKHLDSFAEALQESASRAFPNRGRSFQRYNKVQALMLHWKCDDLFVLPELEDLEKCFREDYNFATDIFAIPSENAHLELMLKIGDMIKGHEADDTLFVVYYGGHARIDESRQSTWCATRRPGSPWLQWSAIQTLLERSISDALILLDCCAGAASATFPTGQSITETISASSWDAIAPNPGRYSFTNALIEVLQEWRLRTFSAAMLHAEVLARLKHPRPILINGKHFEARTTPVHFMMTSNHKAASIEIGRLIPASRRPASPPMELGFHGQPHRQRTIQGRHSAPQDPLDFSDVMIPSASEPNENEPHVMISLALEDDQRLDLNDWEEWLANFPAIAKHVKVQGVFKSHSTLLLLSLPVMVWDLLPDDPACAFIAFIRSNNLLYTKDKRPPTPEASEENVVPNMAQTDTDSNLTGTTAQEFSWASHQRPIATVRHEAPAENMIPPPVSAPAPETSQAIQSPIPVPNPTPGSQPSAPVLPAPLRSMESTTSLQFSEASSTAPPTPSASTSQPIPRTMIPNRTRSSMKMTFDPSREVAEGPQLARHVVTRLEEFFDKDPNPDVNFTEYLASNLGVESSDVHLWFHHRREQEKMTSNLRGLRVAEIAPESKSKARMILPGHLNTLLEIYPSKSVLVIDLRSSTDFDRSHIHEAVNLRAPLSFIQHTSLEMIEDTLVDDESRRRFCKWFQSRCVVFYDRVIEFDWECPVADALFDKFRKKGWLGQCFILKGHYREFSASFDKYISGYKMTKEAKEYLDGVTQRPSPTQDEANQRHERYDAWLRAFESEDRVPIVELVPAKKVERIRALEQRQKDLEAEFEKCFPALARKAKTMGPRPPSTRVVPKAFLRSRPDSVYSTASTSSPIIPPPPPFTATPEGSGAVAPQSFTPVDWKKTAEEQDKDDEAFERRKAPLVGHLAAGLDRMREAAVGATTGTPSPPVASGKQKGSYDSYHGNANEGNIGGYPEKLLEHGDYTSPPPGMEGYEEIDPDMEGLRNDPAFQRAGLQGYQGSAHEGAGPGASVTSFGSASGGDGSGKKPGGASGSGAGASARRRPQLWDRLTSRSGK
ncbi:hypothetical protein V8F06_001063 [Rhypophila decipiens]